MVVASIVLAVLAGIAIGFGLRTGGRAFLHSRGIRVVTCPDNREPAALDLASWRAVLTSLSGKRVERVRMCSRWPARSGCNQACLQQLANAPRATRLDAILANWCRYNACVCCGAPLATVHVGPHRPHLIDRQLRIFEWNEIPPQDIPRTLRDCEPVCETCVAAETRTW